MRKLVVGLLILCLPLNSFSAETQFRQKVTLEKQLDEKWAIKLSSELRWREVIRDLFQQLYEFGVSYQFYPDWYIAATYRHRTIQKDDGWRTSAEPLLDLTKKWKWKGLKFAIRNRFQYRFLDKRWFYRNRPSVEIPIENQFYPVSIVLANEFFYLHGS